MKRAKRFLNVENIILFLIGALSAYVFFTAFGFRKAQSKLMPQVISMGTLVCCIIALVLRIVAVIREEKKARAEKTSVEKEESISETAQPQKKEKAAALKQAGTMIAAVLYVALLEPLGFVLSTLLVLLGLPAALGYRKWYIIIPVAVILSVGLFFLFEKVFYVRLPVGLLTFLR